MAAAPPPQTTQPVASASARSLLAGVTLGFLLALLVGSALYWWANRPIPATMTLEPPAPVATQTIPEPASAPLPADQPARSVGMQAVSGAQINLNSASLAELESLPGIGPAKALAIVAGRPYASVDALDDVPGIGPATLEQLRPLVTIE